MKKVVLGLLVVAGVLVALLSGFGQSKDVYAQRPSTVAVPGVGGDLMVFPITSGDKSQLLAVIDPKQRVMSVYRIDAASAKIALKSVRNLQWDLQLTDFNNEAPLPQEIRSLSEQR
jgi:hypothetical protein